jgi:hypothetical protein
MVALLAVIVVGTVVAVGIAGAKLQRAAPSTAPSTLALQSQLAVPTTPGLGVELQKIDFALPFAYTIPPESGLHEDGTGVTELLGWSSGDPLLGASLDPTAAQAWGPPANAAHGVMIGVGPVWGHGSTCCPGRATPGGSGR